MQPLVLASLLDLYYLFWKGFPELKKSFTGRGVVAHTCHPSYSGGRDGKDRGLRTPQGKS
jgi:hypothetical protein